MTSRLRPPQLDEFTLVKAARFSGQDRPQGGQHSQGSASFMASVGSALLWSLLASFSADVSWRALDPFDLKLKALDFLD